MAAIVVSMRDMQVGTPEQLLRIFFELYTPEGVRSRLWEAFRGYAVNDEKGLLGLTVDEAEVAELFDSINDLVRAVYYLRLTGGGMEKCAFCGRVKKVG